MRTTPVLVGLAAGLSLGLGGLTAIELSTQDASAQGGNAISDLRQEVQAANFRSQAAINGYKNLNNVVGKHFTEPGSVTGARSGPIPQDRGIGGGLPGSLITDGAVSESKLDDALQTKVNSAGSQGPPGPAGPPGARGADGATGPPGPTDGDSGASLVPDPFPTTLLRVPSSNPPTLTTSVSGRVFVTATVRTTVSCSGVNRAAAWVELDGDAIESSYRELSESTPVNASVSGVTDGVVAAGAHEVRVAVACPNSSIPSGSTENQVSASAIVLG